MHSRDGTAQLFDGMPRRGYLLHRIAALVQRDLSSGANHWSTVFDQNRSRGHGAGDAQVEAKIRSAGSLGATVRRSLGERTVRAGPAAPAPAGAPGWTSGVAGPATGAAVLLSADVR